jgi:hypothetical protein
MSTLYGDDYFSPKGIESINKIDNLYNKSNCIYSLDIFMDYEIIHYTREYKDLFLIISNVFPLFRFALYFIKSFTQHVKMSIIKSRLVGLIFENREMSKVNLFQIKRLKNLIDEKDKTKYLSVNDGPKELIIDKTIEPPHSENKNMDEPIDKDKNSNNKSLLMKSNISLK